MPSHYETIPLRIQQRNQRRARAKFKQQQFRRQHAEKEGWNSYRKWTQRSNRKEKQQTLQTAWRELRTIKTLRDHVGRGPTWNKIARSHMPNSLITYGERAANVMSTIMRLSNAAKKTKKFLLSWFKS